MSTKPLKPLMGEAYIEHQHELVDRYREALEKIANDCLDWTSCTRIAREALEPKP